MFKKIVQIILVVFLILPVFCRTTFVYADDEDEGEQEEKSNYDKCIEDKNKEACRIVYREMMGEESKLLKEIQQKIAESEGQMELISALVMEYSQKAQELQVEIDALKIQIDDLKDRIEKLTVQIAENEAKVEALNIRVKNRMVESQKSMHFNGYLEFLLGSKSFTDMLARIYGIEAIVSKDKSDREILEATIKQLNADKQELSKAKEELDKSYEEIVLKQAELLEMQEFYEEKKAAIQAEIDELNNQADAIGQSFSELKAVVADLGISSEFVAAVHNSWIAETVWNYSDDFQDGNWHLGVDYAASRGTAIHAPASGVIIRANGGYADPGYLGSLAGDPIMGGGNQVYMMCEVDGKVYGFIFFHLHDIYVSYGDLVFQDETIGTVGSSGSSTGPHCHIEMYYLGDGSLGDFLDMSWNATFSVGRGRTAYNNRCYYDDGSYRQDAPCILNPEWYLP
ncbi:MAG: peptidoglycan DD-metalloendopeptidase family protein [Erysipelotrichaceae bacterium]|nr:peptidoglycan DD-metalloendopeptidase family protein [Erysipelotrichaceae bacterium]